MGNNENKPMPLSQEDIKYYAQTFRDKFNIFYEKSDYRSYVSLNELEKFYRDELLYIWQKNDEDRLRIYNQVLGEPIKDRQISYWYGWKPYTTYELNVNNIKRNPNSEMAMLLERIEKIEKQNQSN